MRVKKENYEPTQEVRDILEARWLEGKFELPGAHKENDPTMYERISFMCRHGRFYDDDYCLICYRYQPDQHDHGCDGQGW